VIKPTDQILRLKRIEDIGAGRDAPILLDKNERTVPYPNEVFQELLQSISPKELIKYPDQSDLYKKLSEFLCLDSKCLLLTSGADNGLKHIFETFLKPGDEFICLNPTYAMSMVYAKMFDAKVTQVGYNSQLELDIDFLISSITDNTKIVYLPNPNQPTGTLIDYETINRLVRKTADCNALLIFDEAYIEFSGVDSSVNLVPKNENVLVLRTFSKAWGLAGVRLGYLVTSAPTIFELKKVKPLLDINIFAIKAANFLIDRYHLVRDYVNEVQEARDVLLSTFNSTSGLHCIPSYANFIHIRLPFNIDPQLAKTQLMQKGYLVRTADGTATILDGCIRVTIGTKHQMLDFTKALLDIIKKQ